MPTGRLVQPSQPLLGVISGQISAESLWVSWFSQDAQGREGTLVGLGSISSGIESEEGGLRLRQLTVLSGSTTEAK